MPLDMPEFDRWLKQAQNALESATVDKENGYHNWACFKARQAAEYALKGLLRALGKVAVGHSCYKLVSQLKGLDIEIPRRIDSRARFLDRHYIPTRYPDAFTEASPYEFYDKATAQQAIAAAQDVLKFVESQVREGAKGA